MKDSNASPAPKQTGIGDIGVVGGDGLVESVEILRLLPRLTKEQQVDVVVQ